MGYKPLSEESIRKREELKEALKGFEKRVEQKRMTPSCIHDHIFNDDDAWLFDVYGPATLNYPKPSEEEQ